MPLFAFQDRVESFGIIIFLKKTFYYEKLLKCLANFSPGLSENGLLIKKNVYLLKYHVFFMLQIFSRGKVTNFKI